jgi:hypothetical protein
MNRLLAMIVASLLLAVETPKEDSKALQDFEAIKREWSQAQGAYFKAYEQAKTADERQKVKKPDAQPFAERCLKLAETNPDTMAGLAALCWAVRNTPSSEAGKKACVILKGGRLGRTDLDVLVAALDSARTMPPGKPQELAPLVLDRVKQQLDHPRAAGLLTWVCTCYSNDESAEVPRPFAEAADLIAGRFADSPDIRHFCEVLGCLGTSPPWAGSYEKHLRTILDKNRHPKMRYRALFALASVVQSGDEARQDEAEKLYQQFLTDFDGRNAGDDVEKQLRHDAERALEEIRIRGIGKPVPEIEGEDTDGKPMRLSDFKGKVVLVDFWAFW